MCDEGARGLNELVPEIFDPEVEFSSRLAREVEHRTYHGHDGLRAFFGELQDRLGEIRYAPPGSHEEAMSTAMEAQRA